MRYLALASDYDGTLATDGVVDAATIQAIERLIRSGRRLILVTGRELPDLQAAFPRLDLCEWVVAENGALLFNPATGKKRTLAQRPPDSFLEALRRHGVPNVSVGEVIVATWQPHETQVMEAIRDSGLELQIIFNKGAVMVLPSGVNKMTGLCAALQELKLSPHNLVAVGDAENDHAFLDSCECAVAVANSVPALKERADFVTASARGAGVTQLIDRLIESDLAELAAKLRGESILVGKTDGKVVTLPRYGGNVLVCGESGSGKSTLVTGLLERIMDLKYQICLVDPEGDYENLPGCRTVGDDKQAPSIKQLKQALEDPSAQVIVNLRGVSPSDRPQCFSSIIAEIQEFRIRTGRPHWLVLDEAPSSLELANRPSNLLLITVHPGHVSPLVLSQINTVIVLGRDPGSFLREFAQMTDAAPPEGPMRDLERGEALVWLRDENRLLPEVKVEPARSFYFRGPERH